MTANGPWFDSRRGIGLVLLYLVFTLVGVGISVGWDAGLSITIPENVTVPTFVYLYGFLGALAYAFTSLLTDFEKPARDLLQVGLRIPAALLLATGVYLLASFFVSDPSTRVVAGLSFIVGLYVKLSLEALGSLARRLYGMSRRDDAEPAGDEEADTDEGEEPVEPADAAGGSDDADAGDDADADATSGASDPASPSEPDR